MPEKLNRSNLWSLEEYATHRAAFRREVIHHKKHRQVALNEHARLYFEDAMTIRYQIQEMLRIEKVFHPQGIQEELDAYNPLIPDGSNWKATFMLEYEDENQRRTALQRLVGIEDTVWIRVEGCDKVYGIADEDLERSTEEKTSSVHFMRFELSKEMVLALKNGGALSMGIDHRNMPVQGKAVDAQVRDSLTHDLDAVLVN